MEPVTTPPSRGSALPGRSRRAARSTIDDVAAASGVSRGTVSRVLNGERYVSRGAREAVLKAVEDTGYVASRSARSLVTRRSGCIALILCESEERLFADPNLGVLVRGCTRAFAQHDVTVVLMTAGDPDQRRRVVRSVREGFFDGLLLIASHAGDTVLEAFADERLPVVACGRPLGFESSIPFVTADDREGARTAVRHLLDLGRRTIATITGPLDTPGGTDRHASWREVLGARADPDLAVASSEFSYRGGADAMELLLARAPELDAVFVAADIMAAGALDSLRRAGRRVPEDVAVVGFDDASVATTLDPPLTTVRQPFDLMAEHLAQLLIQRVEGHAVRSVTLPTTFVRRRSA